ncbi:hypothetical protein, partial [Salipiger aestuarii]
GRASTSNVLQQGLLVPAVPCSEPAELFTECEVASPRIRGLRAIFSLAEVAEARQILQMLIDGRERLLGPIATKSVVAVCVNGSDE